MNHISSSPIALEWFSLQGLRMGVKAEHREAFRKAVSEQRELGTGQMNERLEQLKQSGGTQKLTEEQKNALSEKYDPQNMTLEEYRSLLDDLCEYGILEEGDKVFVGGENLVPLALSGPMVQVSSYSGPVHPGLGRQGGNVIERANYEASFRTMNVDTQKYEKTLWAVLFGRIGSVLEQL